ncbi:MAG TPA: hypothetical protein VL357_07670 [Rariglobus sp.]|jgi:hypothetical protein|nr:hypothetical protein [Rariglobus sp.]
MAAPLKAEILKFPDEWFARPPTPERIQALLTAVPDKGWEPLSAGLYAGAINAFERGHMDVAESWYYVAAWAEMLGHSQSRTGHDWLEAAKGTPVLNPSVSMSALQSLPDEALSRLLSPEVTAWLLGNRSFSASFFNQRSSLDYLPQVLAILQQLHDADRAKFSTYAQLALAIALVYDSPPPPSWPHRQVTTQALPRLLPRPLDAFNFLADADQHGMTLQKLATLPASELKFAVDLAAPFPELVWVQKTLKFTLAQLPKNYDLIRYRNDRLDAQQYVWPGDSYELARIYKEGGICVDQAYFATETGKARGVPTLFFRGEGQDGRHAWFGYLGSGQRWMLDAGRYADQRFVTGVAIDPQTWTDLSDHDLQFLSEGFRKLPPYQQSCQYELFARLYLQIGKKTEAASAARKAVNYERRNLEAWETLMAASAGVDFRAREALLREASLAFQRYPDLNAFFVRSLAASMRARGETSAADFEERSLARKNLGTRTDLAVDQAAEMVSRVLENTPLPQQLSVYNHVLLQYGGGAGVDFYDRVVRPFVRALASQQHPGDAKRALAQARLALKPDFDSQLDHEMTELADSLK